MSSATSFAILLACAVAVSLTAAFPISDDFELEVMPLAEFPQGTLVLLREKRQNFGRQRYPGQQQYGGRPGGNFQGGRPSGFQQPSFAGSAANAQAQGFQSGNFGANHAGTQTQGFSVGPAGFQGSAGQSFSQNYNLPGGISASVTGAGTFGAGPGGVTQGGGHSVSFTGPNGQPIRG